MSDFVCLAVLNGFEKTFAKKSFIPKIRYASIVPNHVNYVKNEAIVK